MTPPPPKAVSLTAFSQFFFLTASLREALKTNLCTIFVSLQNGFKTLNCELREGVKKKNWEKAVRLTAWVDPPLPSPEAVRKM